VSNLAETTHTEGQRSAVADPVRKLEVAEVVHVHLVQKRARGCPVVDHRCIGQSHGRKGTSTTVRGARDVLVQFAEDRAVDDGVAGHQHVNRFAALVAVHARPAAAIEHADAHHYAVYAGAHPRA
jgi:hypothetical protein